MLINRHQWSGSRHRICVVLLGIILSLFICKLTLPVSDHYSWVAMGSLQLFQNSKLSVKFSYANYDFNEKPQSLHQIDRTTVPFAWPLPGSLLSGPRKSVYRGDNKSIMLNRFCCQSAAAFDELPSVIHAKHEGCASNANVSFLDDPNPRKGLGIVDFMKEKNFLITGATGFVAKVLIEKILRMQPDTGKLFFKELHEIHGNEYEKFMLKKLVPVAGDMTQPNFGVQEDVTDMLIKEVDIIVSSAATTTFDGRFWNV